MKHKENFVKTVLFVVILSNAIISLAFAADIVDASVASAEATQLRPNLPDLSQQTAPKVDVEGGVAATVGKVNAAKLQGGATISRTAADIASADINAKAAIDATRPRYCPFAKELTKHGMQWWVGKAWKSDNDSFIDEITNFVGVQWVGIKYGSVICLYRSKKNSDFPVAIQQVHNGLILEPNEKQWSGLVNNRKMCQSTNVYDCPFFIKPPETTMDIYKQIEYKGVLSDDLQN